MRTVDRTATRAAFGWYERSAAQPFAALRDSIDAFYVEVLKTYGEMRATAVDVGGPRVAAR